MKKYLCILLVILASLTQCSNERSPDIIAIDNGEEIDIDKFASRLKNINQQYYFTDKENIKKVLLNNKKLLKHELRQYLINKALYLQLKKENFINSPRFKDRNDESWNEYIRQKVLSVLATEDYIKNYSLKNKDIKDLTDKYRKIIQNKYKDSYKIDVDVLENPSKNQNKAVLLLGDKKSYTLKQIKDYFNFISIDRTQVEMITNLIKDKFVFPYFASKEALKKNLDKTKKYEELKTISEVNRLINKFDRYYREEFAKTVRKGNELRKYYEQNADKFKKKFEDIKEDLVYRLVEEKLHAWRSRLMTKWKMKIFN